MTTQLIIMSNIVDVVWPTIKNLNKYENVINLIQIDLHLT
jgi:hypothetical protein